MQINLSHGEMFQRIFEGRLPEKTYYSLSETGATTEEKMVHGMPSENWQSQGRRNIDRYSRCHYAVAEKDFEADNILPPNTILNNSSKFKISIYLLF